MRWFKRREESKEKDDKEEVEEGEERKKKETPVVSREKAYSLHGESDLRNRMGWDGRGEDKTGKWEGEKRG